MLVEKLEPLYIVGGKGTWYSLFKVWQFMKMLNIELLHDPAILLLSIHPEEMKHVHTKTCP